MTKADGIELGILAILSLAWAAFGPRVWSTQLGTLCLIVAGTLLAQGLVRDVVKLAIRSRSATGGPRRIVCLCAESTVGMLLLIAGFIATFAGSSQPVALGSLSVAMALPAVTLFGFVAKDFVITIRREKDHASVIVW